MRSLPRVLWGEFSSTVRRPGRLLALLDARRLRGHLSELWLRLTVGRTWQPLDDAGRLQRRVYASYALYLAHQKAKLDHIDYYLDLAEYEAHFVETLKARMRGLQLLRRGMSVLCLGARLGTEVKAFRDLGCFAVGIDVNPGRENAHVLYGDFHELQFPGGSVDAVFTNSLDHALHVERALAEVQRVLKSDGIFIVEAAIRTPGQVPAGFFESFAWASVDDLVALLERRGFNLRRRGPLFQYPWRGETLCLTRE